MGGLLIILVVAVLAYVLDGLDATTYSPVVALLGVGLLGAADDFLNARKGLGISVRQKLIWQLVVAVLAAIYIQRHFNLDGIRVPFAGEVTIGPGPYIVFAAFAIIAASNGVNITDGLDGLAGGTLVFAFIAYLLVALLNEPVQPNLATLCALVVGALLGFLWFNLHPAQVVMGYSGALAGRAATVLGFARSGIALARFLADAGARVTVYDNRSPEALAGAIEALEGRPVRLLLGPAVDPASAWAGAALVTTSPSINPD